MAKIDIYKASAGSGKTHTLTQKYLQYLLQSDDADAYRHILAVTFTNKATDEMKQRVLDTLSKEARKDSPDGRKARRVLISILHDYSNFSITTIDKFFLQIIRAFAREIGQNGSSRVELDEQGVIASAVDSMLDSLEEEQNAPLLDWMVAYALESVEKGGSYDIASSLKEFSKLFLQEDFRIKKGLPGVSFVQNRETIEEVRKLTADRMKAFREKYPPRSRNVDDYARRVNETDKIIMDSVGIMGISSDIYARMTEILREKNLVMLSESKETIRRLIDDSDAPFIYEKVGNRYDHLMLDEFQDTSRVEWSNFLPLYRESLAKGKDCMIVGDIKQSIYRFRGSDWETLNSGLARDFDPSQTHFDTLKINRRSAPNIIRFNNLLYVNIKEWLPDEFAQKILYRVLKKVSYSSDT
ncbi:MAG: UvrD-helicase domain-containing protein [Bacteroidales bacterium]|nr:UvrD-helicase domain-containing protein [Bacteroidales bacterium]